MVWWWRRQMVSEHGGEERSWRQSEPVVALADAGSIESTQTMDTGGDEWCASRPRYRAEDLVYEAWEAAGERRVRSARGAGAVARLRRRVRAACAAASSLEGARELLERDVAAGERARTEGLRRPGCLSGGGGGGPRARVIAHPRL